MAAGARPVFDFSGSLSVARLAWSFGESFATTSASREGARNTALSGWMGVYGDEYRERATDEDQSKNQLLNNLGVESQTIAAQWAEAARQMNDVLYAEAIDRQRAYLDEQIAAAERAREEQNNWLQEIGEDIGDLFGGSAWSGSTSPYDYVETPRYPGPPAAPAFSPDGGFLAQYYRSGHNLNINYVSYVPA